MYCCTGSFSNGNATQSFRLPSGSWSLQRTPMTSRCSLGPPLWRSIDVATVVSSCCASPMVSSPLLYLGHQLEFKLFSVAHNFSRSNLISKALRTDWPFQLTLNVTGNFDKKGALRRQELWNACEVLSIDKADITMLNATHLQDDPNSEWKVEHVAKIIQKHIEMLDVQLLITFDKNGVSSHPNHCAIFYATASLCFSNLIPKGKWAPETWGTFIWV